MKKIIIAVRDFNLLLVILSVGPLGGLGRLALARLIAARKLALVLVFGFVTLSSTLVIGDEKVNFDIPRQEADKALTEFARQASTTVFFPVSQLDKKYSNRLKGSYSIEQGLSILLSGTGFEASYNDKAGVLSVKIIQNVGEKKLKTKTKKGLVSLLASMFILNTSSNATGEETKGSRSVFLEEVLVTAQKKTSAEAVQTVPVSITAFSGAQVDAMFAVNLTDIGLSTPNASLTEIPTFPGVANFVIRGMGTVGASIPSQDPAVGVVIDGISLGTIYGVVTDLFDLESVEVLRGPQGTLFGRNVTGGAIVMRTTRPTEEFQGRVRATMGNFDQKDVSVLVTGPLSENWGGKLAVLSKQRDGMWENKAIGGDQGASETQLIRPAISYSNDNFDATLITEFGNIDADGLASITWWADGGAAGGGFEIDPYDDRVTYQDEVGFSELRWTSIALEANMDLFGGKLTGVFGHRDLDQEMVSDVDGFSGARFHFAGGTQLDQDQQSLEIRWAGDLAENLSLTTGIYLFQQDYRYAERRILANAVDRKGVSAIEHETQGIFFQADWGITDTISLILGGRYTSENKDADIGLIGDPNATGGCATSGANTTIPGLPRFPVEGNLGDCRPVLSDDESWSNFTPKITVNWEIAEDIMAYATYSKGFRSGGYNARFTDLSFVTANPRSVPGPYNEEEVDAYEIGLKSKIWDGRARINLSAFQNDYQELQRTVLNSSGGQETLNSASGSIRGLEIDSTVAVTDNLVLQLGIGLIDAEYDDFAAVEAATGKSASDLKFVLAPDVTYNLALTYDMELANIGYLNWRASYSYVDESFGNDLNTALAADYDRVDASLTFSNDSGFQVALYGRNIFDEVYYDFGTDFSTSVLAVQSFWMTPPRTYGIELTYDF